MTEDAIELDEEHQEWLSLSCTVKLLEAINVDLSTIKSEWAAGSFLGKSEEENFRTAGIREAIELIKDSIESGSFLNVNSAEE